MRRLLVLMLVTALTSATARAEGPDEPRPSTPAQTEPAQPAQAAPAPAAAAPAPTVTAPAPVVAAPAPATAPGLAPDEELVPNPSKKWGWGFLGAAGACALVAIGTGSAALAAQGPQEGNVASPPSYTRSLADDASTGRTLATVSYAFAGIAGALAIVDAIVWFEVLRKPKVVKKEKGTAWLGPTGVRF